MLGGEEGGAQWGTMAGKVARVIPLYWLHEVCGGIPERHTYLQHLYSFI